MAIFSKELPDELKALNLTPEQIAEKVKEAASLSERLTQRDTEFNQLKTDSETLRTGFNEMKAKIDAAEAERQRQQQQQNQSQKGPDFTFPEDAEAFDHRFNEKAGPLAMAALNAAKNSARLAAKLSLEGKVIKTPSGNLSLLRLWDKWESEITKAAEQVPLVNLQNEVAWLNIFNFIKGNHMDELLSKTTDFVEPAGGSSDREVNVGGNAEREPKLSEAEAAQAKKMKIDPKKFLEMKSKMRFVGA